MNRRTLPGLLEARREASPDSPAFYSLDQERRWHPVTWAEFVLAAERSGSALRTEGVGRGDRVGILARTSLQWEYAQMGALRAGALVAGIDPNYSPDQLAHVLRLLEPSVLFVENQETLARLPDDLRARIRLTILIEEAPKDGPGRSIGDLLAVDTQSAGVPADGPSPSDPAVMVFTSGTTGLPKAIVFSHEQVLTAVDSILAAFDDIHEGTVLLCWLPLANLFQRVINFCAVGRGATSYILSDPRELMTYVGSVQPEILIGVPRVFERIQAGIAARIAASPRPARYLADWALRTAHRRARRKAVGERSGVLTQLSGHVADALVLRRLRAAFGGRLRYFVSGSAPMPSWLLEWFEAVGMPILEAYGISENIVPMAINRYAIRRPGTVGQPLGPNEIRLATDGEIQVRGPGVFVGYWGEMGRSADDRYTADGFCSTGDLGELDDEGFLRLIGRKSEVFKSAGGRWVSPARVEERLRRLPYVEQAAALALPRGSLGAILSVEETALARRLGMQTLPTGARSDAEPLPQPVQDVLRADLKAAFEGLPAYLHPGGILITLRSFSIAGGELTVNLKLRRSVVAQRLAAELAALEAAIDRARSASTDRPVVLLA
jgi:long-chain acyl-CoA synthetase